MKLAERMDRILVESAFEVLVRARALEAAGRSVVHLEIGEPDFPTPAHIVAAAKIVFAQAQFHAGVVLIDPAPNSRNQGLDSGNERMLAGRAVVGLCRPCDSSRTRSVTYASR